VLIDEVDAKGEVTFAIVAASATIRNSSASVLIQNRGFSSGDVDIASQAAMKTVQGGGLNVMNFGEFNVALEKAVDAVIASPIERPLLVGVSRDDDDELSRSVAKVFAVSYYADGKSEEDAIREFPGAPQIAEPAIRETFVLLNRSGPPSLTAGIRRQLADQIMFGNRLRKKGWLG
jgi:hypothetical protein